MRYGQKHVVSLSSPFLISFGCFWSHFEGKPVWGWGWGVMGLGCGLFPRHPGEHPRYSLPPPLERSLSPWIGSCPSRPAPERRHSSPTSPKSTPLIDRLSSVQSLLSRVGSNARPS